jgi:hypothetical protein
MAILSLVMALGLASVAWNVTSAQNRESDRERVANRPDVRRLPGPLRSRLVELAGRPHSYLPLTVFSEADSPSMLFQFYLIDTSSFQPNVFTTVVPGVTDGTLPTGTGPNRGLSTIGAIRLVLEPKPGLPTDPNDVRAFIDIFTDVSGLFVINNESGWYEGWMIRDIRVPRIAAPRPDGTSQYGTMTPADAAVIAAMGTGNNVPGNIFTLDGNAPRFGSANDRFPDPLRTPNTVPFPVSLGTFNSLQQSDIHAYWEFNPGTNWVFPHYELPFTGGVPGTFEAGLQYAELSLIPGSGPSGVSNDRRHFVYGDDPDNPRDPDRAEVTTPQDPNRPQPGNPAHLEFRNRFIPSNLTEELLVDVFVRVRSFEPGVGMPRRLLDAYAWEVARVDQNGDGVLSFQEADVNGTSDGLPNTRLYLPATAFNRYAMTREINDSLLAPRFAPSQRAYVLSGMLVAVQPGVPASVPRDADDR